MAYNTNDCDCNHSATCVKCVKQFLLEEMKIQENAPEARLLKVMPILHNVKDGTEPFPNPSGEIYLQFNGWSINLRPDGTWMWEDTTGG